MAKMSFSRPLNSTQHFTSLLQERQERRLLPLMLFCIPWFISLSPFTLHLWCLLHEWMKRDSFILFLNMGLTSMYFPPSLHNISLYRLEITRIPSVSLKTFILQISNNNKKLSKKKARPCTINILYTTHKPSDYTNKFRLLCDWAWLSFIHYTQGQA